MFLDFMVFPEPLCSWEIDSLRSPDGYGNIPISMHYVQTSP
jgi:hypothetical protein